MSIRFQSQSLSTRLTVAYGLSIFAIIVVFTASIVIPARIFAKAIDDQLAIAQAKFPVNYVLQHPEIGQFHRRASDIEKQLHIAGVAIFVDKRFDMGPPPDGGDRAPKADSLNDQGPSPAMGSASDHGGDLLFGPGPANDQPDQRTSSEEGAARDHALFPNRQHFVMREIFKERDPDHGKSMQFDSRLDVVLSMLLNLYPKEKSFDGGRALFVPLPMESGQPIVVFFIETIGLLVLLVIAAGMVGRQITLKALHPLYGINSALENLASGQMSEYAVSTGTITELQDIAENYNRAAAQVTGAITQRINNENAMRTFMADAGHELRTPLTVILGYMDILRDRPPTNPDAVAHIHRIVQVEGQRMREMIERLNLLTKLDSGLSNALEVLDVYDFAMETISALRPLDPEGRIFVHGKHGVIISANGDELTAALRNLIENAIKYAPAGAIEVECRVHGTDALISVKDHGPGIDEAERERLFERFYRGAARDGVSGSGLGLSIVARAAERAGGTVEVSHNTPTGTVFTLRIPTVVLT